MTLPTPAKSIGFFGTPELSAVYLRALLEADYPVSFVVTQPDRRRGRGSGVEPSPTKEVAVEHAIPVLHSPRDIPYHYELGVVVAYGRIIPPPTLDKALHINLHYSLLPKYRGAAPMERAILEGEVTTGVCLMRVVEELDAGPIYLCRALSIEGMYLTEVAQRLTSEGVGMLLGWLDSGADQTEPAEQVGVPTYAEKILPEDLRIHWHEPAEQIMRTIRLERAFTQNSGVRLRIETADLKGPTLTSASPGSVIEISRGEWGITCGDELLVVPRTVRPAGKASQTWLSYLNGRQDLLRLRFDSLSSEGA